MPTYADFVQKNLQVKVRAGHEWQCLCPYHEDNAPSFSVNVRKGVFVCYACGAKGNIKQLAQHLGVVQGSATLEEHAAGVKDKIREYMTPVTQKIIAPEWLQTWRLGDDYRSMWATRGIVDERVLNYFCLGYEPISHQLVIPVHKPNANSVVSYIRRNLGELNGRPKYLYQHEFKISQNLYGSWQVRAHSPVARIRSVAITEGSIDTLSMWQVGIPSVAILGSRVSSTQLSLLEQLDPIEYVIMTDHDTAGRKAAVEIATKLRRSGIIVSEPADWPSHAKDPADLTPDERVNAFNNTLIAKY